MFLAHYPSYFYSLILAAVSVLHISFCPRYFQICFIEKPNSHKDSYFHYLAYSISDQLGIQKSTFSHTELLLIPIRFLVSLLLPRHHHPHVYRYCQTYQVPSTISFGW
ncbi:hypothetical protein F4811DRAFT_120793 [Daldinia bambusicola]|nr:hypothetical protein F4811DRAFT_120793 [Daldinia bambusicola]